MTEKLTPIPLYEKVKERLITQIDEGVWRAGTALPNEFKLADELGVSQGTVRKALIELEKLGAVQRVQGKGTFVTTNTPERALFHFFRLANKDGERIIPTTNLLGMSVRKATLTEATTFSFDDKNTNLVEIKRLRSIKKGSDSVPTLIETILISADMFPNFQNQTDLPDALYPYYQEKYHQSVLSAEENLTAVGANFEEADLLGIKIGSPLLSVARTARDLRGRVIEYRISRFLTEDHVYHVDLK